MTQLSSRLTFGIILTLLSNLVDYGIAMAQIIPDNSLGAENSRTRPDTIKNTLSDVIEGGATRGSNLFHSFREFNVNEGRGAYFANPDVIQNIFSRVTGGNISQILGTLGVLGNANLFLINPNGIIFGPNARLDLRGAFIGATADSVVFDNNFEFSATNPNAPPLLTVNIPLGLRFRETSADISSTANLATPSHLTLKAGNLNIGGTLVTGGDLTLEALNTLTIRDSVISPFIAFSGGNLLLQGNQGIDIYALNHPQSGIISGGDLVLRSTNAVSGDAHYWSGGRFRIEKLDGTLGGLVSLYDPIIRASGDVYLDSYTGTSLHILAGGSVYIPGTILITGVDETGDTLAETVTLSDGSMINIDGSVEPTLDIRAGTTAVGSPFDDTGTPTSADISIGSIEVYDAVNETGGKVFLTNQYQPNTALPSANGITVGVIDTRDVLGGGSVIIDARSSINLDGIVDASAYLDSNMPSYLGNGGNVTLLSVGNLLSNSSILAQGLFGGNVTLKSVGDVLLDNGLEINVRGGGGGNITINAQNVNLLNASKLRAGIASGLGTPEAQAGDITINATGSVAIANDSFIANVVQMDSIGNAGSIEITIGSLILTDGGQIAASTFGQGNAGTIKITASETISIAGEDSEGNVSGIFSQVASTAEGNSGGIEITTGSLSLTDGAQLNASTFGVGDAGSIFVRADGSVALVDSNIFNNVESGAVGNAGGIFITAQSLFLKEGSQLQSGIRGVSNTLLGGRGNGGNVSLDVRDTLSLTGVDNNGLSSAIFTDVESGAVGNGGNIKLKAGMLSLADDAQLNASTSGVGNAGGIEISTGSLFIADGAVVNASTFGKGDAGTIKITASETISIAGEDSEGNVSGIFSTVRETGEGNSGGIEISTGSLFLVDGAVVNASTFGRGNAGTIKITAREVISLYGLDSNRLGSYIRSQVASTAEGNSGGIEITTGSLSLTDGAQLNASTFGVGDAGSIFVRADGSVALVDSNIFNNVESGAVGNAGGIFITAQSLFLKEGSQLQSGIRGVSDTLSGGRGNGGNVSINVRDTLSLTGVNNKGFSSAIYTDVESGAVGNGGNIKLKAGMLSLADDAQLNAITSGVGNAGSIEILTGSLSLVDGARVIASTFGRGNAGAIRITARETISIAGQDNQGNVSGIFNTVAKSTAEGNSGGIEIITGSLSLTDGARVSASTFGVGDAGGIIVQANSSVALVNSNIFNNVESGAVGNAGGIFITAQSLFLKQGSQLQSGIRGASDTLMGGRGNGGNVSIDVRDTLSLTGVDDNGFSSAIFTDVESGAVGNGGNIKLKAGTLSLADKAQLNAITSGVGNAGNIEISTGSLSLVGGAQLNASTFGVGEAGVIKITASETISITGEDSQKYASGIFSTVENTGEGNSGGIEIITGSLSLSNGAAVNASTFGRGNAGAVKITASDTISIAGEDSESDVSGIFSTVAKSTAQGNSGGIEILTGSLSLTDGAAVNASTFGKGNAGAVELAASETITAVGEDSQGDVSGIFSTVETTGEGNSGGIKIITGSLSLTEGAAVDASTLGRGNAGAVKITASNIIFLTGEDSQGDASRIASAVDSTAIGNSAGIEITTSSLTLNDKARVSAETLGKGTAGNITITANTLENTNASQIQTNTQTNFEAGDITLNISDTLNLSNSSLIAKTTGEGKAGNITINASKLNLIEGATISAGTSAQGDGGSITIKSPLLIALGENSQLNVETSGAGQAGNIEITSNSVTIGKDAQISATATRDASNTSGGGSININASNLNIAGKLGIFAETSGIAPAGTLTLNPDNSNPNLNILFIEQGLISASTSASGNGGDINISAPNNIDISGNGTIATSTSGTGNAGTINLNTNQLNLTNGVTVTASTSESGNAGNINLNATQINLQQATVTAFTDGGGNAGSINVPSAQTINLDNSTISTEIQAQGVATEASNITLTSNTLELNNSNISASTAGKGNAGEITLINQQLNLNNNSKITAISTGVGNAGSISLPETQNLSLNQSEISVSTNNTGNAGSITVPTAQNLTLNQSKITASTSGVGNTGTIALTASEKIELNESEISNAVEENGIGNALTITLNTPQLSLQNSSITSSTDGIGNAGSIVVPNAQTINLTNSTISTEIQAQGVATEASNITIQTQQLTLDNNSQITATTSGDGNAGTITITADSLRLTNRSSIQTNTSSSGIAGDLVFNLTDELTLDNSTLEASTDPNSTGNGGSIRIDPTTVNLNNNARISVNSQGVGDGGNLSLEARNLSLRNNSAISATTASGEGGNITLNVLDTVTQRNNSPISATASGTGNGGNITLNTRFLVGNENSNITANAFQGRGGNINITADGIFRGSNSPISASSQLGVDGVVQTNTPEVDPSRGLLNLPQNPVDPNTLIAQNACRRGGQSEFTVTGRGGLPNTPEQVQRSNEVEVSLVEATQQTVRSKPKKQTQAMRKIIPAQGWQRNDKGEMVLVAYPTTDNAHRQTSITDTCSLNQ